jgi:hypothetical protein
MTLNQLNSLTDEELGMALVVVNHISPIESPKMTFEPRHLTWFKHDMLIKKLLDSFNRLKPEGHATYVSLMQKLGVCIQIKQHTNEPTRTENTGSNQCPPTASISTDVQNLSGSNATGQPA